MLNAYRSHTVYCIVYSVCCVHSMYTAFVEQLFCEKSSELLADSTKMILYLIKSNVHSTGLL